MKKLVLIALPLVVLIGLGVILWVNKDKNISEAELREKFGCDRVTADVRATDIYCQSSKYYFDDVKNGTVIDSNDFNDPRYKALFESRYRS